MANIYPRRNKNNEITSFTIRVYRGRGSDGAQLKPYTTTFKPDPKWSEQKAEKEAQRAAILFEKQCKEGFVADNRQSFEDYADYVIEYREKNGLLKATTAKGYRTLLKRIKPAIGYIKLQDLKPQHLNLFYEQLSADGINIVTKKGLSTKTILEYHRCIHMILENAVKEMLVQYNVADRATPPKHKRKEANFFERQTLRRIRRYFLTFEPLVWQVTVLLLMYTGGRRGEVCGLKVDKINREECSIHFCNNLLYTPEKGLFDDTLKTASSDRFVTVEPFVMRKIDQLIELKKEWAKQMGNYWHKNDYLLCRPDGQPMRPDTVTLHLRDFEEKFNKIIEEKNKTRKIKIEPLPHLNPHAFRHTHVSLLLLSGVDPLTASKRVGHASPTTSYTMYGHIMKEADKRAAQIFSNALN